MIEEQLASQEEDVVKLFTNLKAEEKTTQEEILQTAQEIKNWHDRIQKANNAGRKDLADAAQSRVNTLLRQGNQLWGKMQGFPARKQQAKDLLQTIKVKRQEVRTKAAEIAAKQTSNKTPSGWNQGYSPNNNFSGYDRSDPLEAKFREWEADEELQRMKKNLGK
jgi:uncharacterized protein (TIGR04376 family)